ncbi:MAG TPA: potassium-transporting ATPase subunit KdpA, partial [Bordetella sp.]|nr:potassium-transporting ATPase subunit KdpA [Bordetella sp.]
MDSGFAGLLALYLGLLLFIAPFLGRYIRLAMQGDARVTGWGAWFERGIYRLAGVDATAGMGWKRYAAAVLLFNVLGVLAVYALQRTQGMLWLNPQGFGAVAADSAFNTAISFVTNTNWQGYAGESTMSHLTQMLGLAVQNFVSAATGISVLFALIRGLAGQGGGTVGNFWADLTRSTLYILLPLSVLLALALASQGVIQNFDAALGVHTL